MRIISSQSPSMSSTKYSLNMCIDELSKPIPNMNIINSLIMDPVDPQQTWTPTTLIIHNILNKGYCIFSHEEFAELTFALRSVGPLAQIKEIKNLLSHKAQHAATEARNNPIDHHTNEDNQTNSPKTTIYWTPNILIGPTTTTNGRLNPRQVQDTNGALVSYKAIITHPIQPQSTNIWICAPL